MNLVMESTTMRGLYWRSLFLMSWLILTVAAAMNLASTNQHSAYSSVSHLSR